MSVKYINIAFPFENSNKGFFVKLTMTSEEAIKSDLAHLVLTQKGYRLYDPEFGTNLLKYIFEPNDQYTYSQIRDEISFVVGRYLPRLKISEINITESDNNPHLAIIRIDYIITDDAFQQEDFIIIEV